MLSAFANSFKIPELRQRIENGVLNRQKLLRICRLGARDVRRVEQIQWRELVIFHMHLG